MQPGLANPPGSRQPLAERGFTLIELLVVIAIIGILAAVALISMMSARSKARDAKRLSDVREITKALELYYNDNAGYPDKDGSNQPTGANWSTLLALYPPYPSPSGSNCGITAYDYEPASDFLSYSLTFCLENPTGGLSSGTHTASQAGIE